MNSPKPITEDNYKNLTVNKITTDLDLDNKIYTQEKNLDGNDVQSDDEGSFGLNFQYTQDTPMR